MLALAASGHTRVQASDAGATDAALSPPASSAQEAGGGSAAHATSDEIDSIDDHAALERAADRLYRLGDYRRAGMAYARLIGLTLADPDQALPYVLCRWHVRQEYEAQAAMIRALQSDKTTPVDVRELRRALDGIYPPESIIADLRLDFPTEGDAAAIDALARHWEEASAAIAEAERERDADKLGQIQDGLFGRVGPAMAFHSLWRTFALADAGDLDAAELQLTIAARELADDRTRMEAATASALMRDLRRSPLSNSVLNSLSKLYSDAADSAGGRLSEDHVSVADRFERVREMLAERRFAEASAALDRLRPAATEQGRRSQYIFFRAETLWGLEEYARANQGYTASSVLQTERFSVAAALYRMAEYAAMIDNRAAAAAYAVRSAGILRDQAWKLRQVGNFFLKMELPERGIAYLERSLDASQSLADDADSYSALARAHQQIGDRERYLGYAREYVETIEAIMAVGNDVTPDQEGTMHYYRGEVLAAEERHDEARAAYERASEIVTERFRLAEIFMILADYRVAIGDTDEAAALAVRSADLLPEQGWKSRQVGAMLLRLGHPALGMRYLENALEHSPTVPERALSYAALSDAHRGLGDMERAFHYAAEYIALVKAHRDMLTDEEEGLAAYYQAEIHVFRGDVELAYPEYERAARLASNRFRRADALMKMAEYQAARGSRAEAATLADQSAADLADQGWKMKQAGDFFLRLDMPERALEYYTRFATMATPGDPAGAYAIMADAYKGIDRTDLFTRYARQYIDAVHAEGRVPTPAQEGVAAYYQAEIYRLDGDADAAYPYYERAARLLPDQQRRYEVYLFMATHQAERGNHEKAAAFAELALEAAPQEEWKIRRITHLFRRIGMPERAEKAYERLLAVDSDPARRAADLYALADIHKRAGEEDRFAAAAREYIDLIQSGDFEPGPNEIGLRHYLEGELLATEDPDAAYRAYDWATRRLTDKYRHAEALMRMAAIEADRDNRDDAAALAERSLAILPGEEWKERQVANFYSTLGMTDRALELYERRLDSADTPEARAEALSSLAELFRREKNEENYLRYARRYLDATAADGFELTREGRALRHFYEGDVLAAEERPDDAVEAFGRALPLITDKFRLSETHMRIARLEAARGNIPEADRHAELALESLPDQAWKAMEIGYFYNSVDQPAKAASFFRRAETLTPESADRLGVYTALAGAYRRMHDMDQYVRYAERYADAVTARGGAATPDERGQALYYWGEIHTIRYRDADAFAAYEEAAATFSSPERRFDALMHLARIHALRDRTVSAAAVAREAGELLPDVAARQRTVGDFFSGRGDVDSALVYYRRVLDLARNDSERAAAYGAFAGAYAAKRDHTKYAEYAWKYVETVAGMGDAATAAQLGMQDYYIGEIHTIRKEPDLAYWSYYAASERIEEPSRLSEVYLKMARHNRLAGDHDLAAWQATRAADLAPHQSWRVADAAGLLADMGRYDEALALLQRSVEWYPYDTVTLYRRMAQIYRLAKDKPSALAVSEMHIDRLTEQVIASGGAHAPSGKLWELWNARSAHAEMSRPFDMGLDSYYYGRSYDESKDYFIGMSHELYKNYRLTNGMRGKFYMTFGGTLTAKWSGTYLSNGQIRDWESRPRLPDSSYFLLGVSINPFTKGRLTSLAFKAEYLLGTGRNIENDFRFRITYDRSQGGGPRPYGRYWHYWKVYSNTTYSTREKVVTSSGYVRQGVTIASYVNSNFLINPHATIHYDYAGRNAAKSRRWGADFALGVSLKRYFGETKYKTAIHKIDLNLYYQWGLTHGRENGPGFLLSTEF